MFRSFVKLICKIHFNEIRYLKNGVEKQSRYKNKSCLRIEKAVEHESDDCTNCD